MSTNTVSASSQAVSSGQTNLAAVYGSAAARGPHRRGGQGGKGSSGNGSEGFTVLASLVQALTQAAGARSAAAAPAAGTTDTTGAAATAGASAAAGSAPAGTTSSASTNSRTPATSLAQDLQAFLHDLVQALRQASQTGHGRGIAGTPGPVTTTSAATTTSAPATTGDGSIVASAPATTGSGSAGSNAAATAPVTSPATANTGAAAYGQSDIISALQALRAQRRRPLNQPRHCSLS